MTVRKHPAPRPCMLVLLWHAMCCVATRVVDFVTAPYELKVFVVTANNAGKKVTQNLYEDLLSKRSPEADIVIVGFQEDKSEELPNVQSLVGWDQYKVDYSNVVCPNGLQRLRVFVRHADPGWTIEKENLILDKKWSAKVAEDGVIIDTNQHKYGVRTECGKGFAIIKLKFTSLVDQKQILNVCAMVTHMSASGTAEYRAQQLDNSYHITREAGCDFTVFAGDFNSRLHCSVPQDDWKVPVYSRCKPSQGGDFSQDCIRWKAARTEPNQESTDSSMQYILAEFCPKDGGGQTRCSLRQGDKKQADELVQLLNNQFIECFEGKDAKDEFENEAHWQKNKFENPLSELIFQNQGWKELKVPDFTPTYKVGGCSGTHDREAWEGHIESGKCWQNEDQKGKHNPAWTDRILVAGKDHIRWIPGRYKAIVSSHSVADHLPVFGDILLDVGQSNST